MKKVALVAFNGEPMCFVHVLLNGLEMKEKGYDVKLVIEGSAVKAAAALSNPEHNFHQLYKKTVAAGIIDAVCQACAAKMGVLETLQSENLPIKGDMKGHPALSNYLEAGYEIITF